MTFDRDQLEAINATSNAVVSAGAGAGKTSVLVERYVRLVAEHAIPVEEILTLTFTRKAAAEMHERIYGALADRSEDNAFVAEQLRRFDSAVISTLDSFCGSVARSGCSAFGLASTFAVDEAALETFCDDLAFQFLNEQASGPDAEALHSLIRLNRFGPLWHDGFAGMAKDHFLVSRRQDFPAMLTVQREHLLSQVASLSADLDRALAEIRALEGAGVACVEKGIALVSTVDTEDIAGGRLVSDLRDHDGDLPLSGDLARRVAVLRTGLAALGGLKKTCGSSKKPEVVVFKEAVDAVKDLAGRLSDLVETLESWPNACGAGRLAAAFQEIVLAEKRRTGVLSYHDVSALAISVLQTNHELRAYYKNRFKAIMIDEFQDNNDEQKQLLYLLAERADRLNPGIPSAADLDPGKLFFVGDEKQSIYRFRGADVSVFKQLSEELGGEDASILLASNYRSEPGLIRFFNSFFNRVFTNPGPDYEARFAALGSRDAVPGVTPVVELWNLASPEDRASCLGNNEAEAFHLARLIRERVEAGTLMVADDGPDGPFARPAEYHDIAILLRSTGNQMQIERMLRLMGVPYVATTARSLFLEAPLNDIAAVLALVLYPHDRVALAAFLRGPLVGMGDEGLVRVLAGHAPLFAPVPGLSAVDTERYDLARTRHEELTGLADTARLTDLLHTIWYRWGYRYHLLRRPENSAYLEHYDYIYELARAHEDGGLAEFLATLRRNMGSIERLDELNVVRGEAEGVKIMTIHKSKGLEFPVVILANMGNRGRTDSISDAPFYDSPDLGLVFNVASVSNTEPRERPVNAIYRDEREQAALRNEAELRRLLYVGATRAMSHLVFCGHLRGQDTSLLAMATEPFHAAAAEVAADPGVHVTELNLEPVAGSEFAQVAAGVSALPGATAAHAAKAGLAAASAGEVVPRSAPRRAFTVTGINAAVAEVLAGDSSPNGDGHPQGESGNEVRELVIDTTAGKGQADAFGTFAHYCVEQLGTERANERELLNPAMLRAGLRPALEGKALDQFLAEGVELARRFLRSTLWEQAAGAVSRDFELPFLLRLDPAPGRHAWVRGKMDLVIQLADRVLVVDFKTDRRLEAAHYHGQLALYRRASESIFRKPATSILYNLRNGDVVEVEQPVDDAIFAAALNLLRTS